jgi:hypothetical protein
MLYKILLQLAPGKIARSYEIILHEHKEKPGALLRRALLVQLMPLSA